jgi:ATP-dependent RNA helicase SUPV3L1/SUV3
MEFKTEILENNNVMIDDHFIGKINGLKLLLDLKKGALETDIRSKLLDRENKTFRR